MDEAELQELFAGIPAGPVPQVDPEDVKTIWKQQRDIEQRHPGELCAVAAGDYIRKPDATVRAIGYRATMLGMVCHLAHGVLEPWTKEDQLDDAVFRAIAEVPMEWMGREIGRQGLPFDFEDFMRRVRGK